MIKRLGCLHAHYSNIEYIENALSSFDVELVHFVDPALMYQVTYNENFNESDAQNKVKVQLEWIAQCNVDAILITCTNYITLLKEEDFSIDIPIIKIDEPYFESICKIEQPQILLFTNPATVKGTVDRLQHYTKDHKKHVDFEVIVVNNSFELIMQGLKKEYDQEIINFLNHTIKDDSKVVSVAQLSMVDAAKEFESKTSIAVINPLHELVFTIVEQLNLKKRI